MEICITVMSGLSCLSICERSGIPGPMQASGYELIRRTGVPGDALLNILSGFNHALLSNITGELEVGETTFKAEHSEQVGEILLDEFRKAKRKRYSSMARRSAWHQSHCSVMMASWGVTRIQPTHYYDTLITNDTLNASVRDGANQSKEFDGHDFCFPNNVVPECTLSACANQVGMSTIAFTSDNYLVIVGQKEANAFSKRLWAPSGSGSADWKDVGSFNDLQEFVKFAARRTRKSKSADCKLTTLSGSESLDMAAFYIELAISAILPFGQN